MAPGAEVSSYGVGVPPRLQRTLWVFIEGLFPAELTFLAFRENPGPLEKANLSASLAIDILIDALCGHGKPR